jgi:predicted GH43/DUF377 family glycosyl hydrolase
MNKNFVAQAIDAGGVLKPLLISPEQTNGTGLFNPSVYIDNDEILVSIRHCQYLFYHSEKKKFEHQWGPLLYLNPENDITLTTTNYLAKLDENLEINWLNKIDTSMLDVKPIWEFIGLEDVRLVRWENKLYATGVRRDTTTNGQGRMELSTLDVGTNYVKEIDRWRIPAPDADDTYCEKNWMPILDMPYHYVKWSNPLEIVKVDPVSKTCEVVLQKQQQIPYYYRGGSQVIKLGDYWVCLPHIVYLHRSEADKKDAIYRHGFIVWDKDWNLIRYTKPFSFMDADVEFCCGMAQYKGRILITFGYQDNAAFILSVTPEFLIEFINNG